jgi:flagellar protein FlbD
MISLHKLNGDEFLLNINIIETIEERPDTTITLINDKKLIVKERKEDIFKQIVVYQKKVFFHDEERS